MADNMHKKYTESLTREIEVGANVPGGTLVLDGDRPAVTLAASGGSTRTQTLADGSTVTTPNAGGVGYRTNCAVVAYDGTWLFPVDGVESGETVGDAASGTNQGTPVYKSANGETLSLVNSGTDPQVGVIDDGYIVGNIAPVLIGVGA